MKHHPQWSFVKNCLAQCLRFVYSPAIIVIDCCTLDITSNQGRRSLLDDPMGKKFPWPDAPITSLLTGKILRNVENNKGITELQEVDLLSLGVGMKGLYFAAKWVSLCVYDDEACISSHEFSVLHVEFSPASWQRRMGRSGNQPPTLKSSCARSIGQRRLSRAISLRCPGQPCHSTHQGHCPSPSRLMLMVGYKGYIVPAQVIYPRTG